MRLVLALIALFGLSQVALAQDTNLWPKVPAATGAPHPEGSEYWRKNHMKLMIHDRDLVVREGDRNIEADIGRCFDCHAVKDTAGNFVTAEDDRHFCRVCHDYAAVQVDCFMCHRSTPDPNEKKVYSMAKPEDPDSIVAYLARLNARAKAEPSQ